MAGTTLRDAGRIVAAAVNEASALVFPTQCAGCDTPGAPLCGRCRAALAGSPTRRELGSTGSVDGLVVWSGIPFDGVAARVVRAIKEQARPGLARALAPALRSALAALALEVGAASDSLVVVPVPTGAASLRARGFRVVDLVVRRAGLVPQRRLRHARRTVDQRGLGVAGRAANLAGSMVAFGVAGRRVVIADDVLTSGATLLEAARALRAAGAVVVGAATVAATPRRLPASTAAGRAGSAPTSTHSEVSGDMVGQAG